MLLVGLGVALTEETTPLSHFKFLPTFTHVNFFPDPTEVWPAFAQEDPALTAERLDSALTIENTTDMLKTKVRLVRGMILILEH